MNPDHTDPKGAVWSGSILFTKKAVKVYCSTSEQTTVVLKARNGLN